MHVHGKCAKPPNSDSYSDHGLFQVAVSNLPSNMQSVPLGMLYVAYKVRLHTPKQ